MNAILLVAHGSRRRESNEEVCALAEQLKAADSVKTTIVHAAFLDMTEPSIPAGIAACVQDGATSIVLIPYFLNSGRHVISDVPAIAEDTMKQYPGVTLKIAPHLGESGLMAGVLTKIAESCQSNSFFKQE